MVKFLFFCDLVLKPSVIKKCWKLCKWNLSTAIWQFKRKTKARTGRAMSRRETWPQTLNLPMVFLPACRSEFANYCGSCWISRALWRGGIFPNRVSELTFICQTCAVMGVNNETAWSGRKKSLFEKQKKIVFKHTWMGSGQWKYFRLQTRAKAT